MIQIASLRRRVLYITAPLLLISFLFSGSASAQCEFTLHLKNRTTEERTIKVAWVKYKVQNSSWENIANAYDMRIKLNKSKNAVTSTLMGCASDHHRFRFKWKCRDDANNDYSYRTQETQFRKGDHGEGYLKTTVTFNDCGANWSEDFDDDTQ